MKNSYLFAALLLLAGVQTALAQPGMLVWQNGKYNVFNVDKVDRVEFVDDIRDYMEYEYVDLGLPSGTLWATCNVGADSPEEYGDYFAWGETETKSDFSWSTYKWINAGGSSYDQVNKYPFADNQTAGCWYSDGSFVGDNKLRLCTEDDAAASAWGSDWQMPTREQFEELMNSAYTTQEYTTLNGVKGQKITGKNGNSIFLPGAGFCQGTASSGVGEIGYYWSRSLSQNYCDYGSFFWFFSGSSSMTHTDRYLGLSIRPVRRSYEYVDLGLPSGTLWATCNVGASSPEEYGDYFAWGETKPKSIYDDDTYFDSDDGVTLKKYNGDGNELLPEDDAATANWGSDWQMPSVSQVYELLNSSYTTTTWTTQNGVNGLLVTGKNGNSIFLPAAGYYNYVNIYDKGTYGGYWTLNYYSDPGWQWNAYCLGFGEDISTKPGLMSRTRGLPVRPVRKK